MIEKVDLTDYKDSKQLSKKQREFLYTQIKSHANQYGRGATRPSKTFCTLLTSTGRASAQEIDTLGIIQCIQLACLRGIGELLHTYYQLTLREQLLHSDFGEDILAVPLYDELFSAPITEHTVIQWQQIPNSYATLVGLVRDGNHKFALDTVLELPVVTIIKGDQKNPLISAASIVAKVERDAYMTHTAAEFPKYHMEKHKGYGSKLHRESIATHGLSPLHRSSYCKNISISKDALRDNSLSKDAISCVPITAPQYERVATRPSTTIKQ